MNSRSLAENIKSKSIKVGIIGLGYVGLPLAIRFSEENIKTTGFDIDKEKIKKINSGQSYINHISSINVKKALKNKLVADYNFSYVKNMNVIIICVPTPLYDDNSPNMSFIRETINSIAPYLKKSQLLILQSSTYPGTTEEEIVPVIEKLGFKIGYDYFVGYSPEREDPGNINFNTKNIPKVVAGFSDNCLKLTELLFAQIIDKIVPVSSLKTAEMTKIIENSYRAVNIGLINEFKTIADEMNIDIYEVIKAASTKPFGFTPYYPGPGIGGHCIPIDPYFLKWKAEQKGLSTRFIELAGEINNYMPFYFVDKAINALNKMNINVNNSNILILGVAYKKNIDDIRESPSLTIINEFLKLRATVKYSDPYLPTIPRTRKFNFNLKSIKISKRTLQSFDLILLCTDHDKFDYQLILNQNIMILDTRGRLKKSKNVIYS